MKVSIIGASGYAGEELIRLLHGHPHAEIAHLTSERHTGEKISKLYPHLTHIYDNILDSMEDVRRIAEDSDVLFIALPHGHAMKLVKAIAGLPVHIIDRGAHLIGNAGCYTTASILALTPLVQKHLVQMDSILIDAVSGVSGAGRTPKESTHFPEFYDSFTAYGAVSHRHTPEIEQALSEQAGEPVTINFTPHLAPIARGILATCYARLADGVTEEDVDAAFAARYADEFFIRLLGRGAYPSTKYVRGTNYCDIAWHIDPRTHRVIVFSAIDNLVKGAAGQAIQNMNIALDLDERTGLDLVPMYP